MVITTTSKYLDRRIVLKPDGASIRSPLGFVDSTTIYEARQLSYQTISLHETAVAVETVGDQSSILFARTDDDV